MSATEIKSVTATAVPLLLDDIDTDRIIPARFLRCVTFEGLGEHAFEDDRHQDASHPFNQPQYQGAGILIAGRNFGCGSSREHAPQSLMRWGIKAILAESFAEIFFGNCATLGIPCVMASASDIEALGAAVNADPSLELTIDVTACEVRYGDRAIPVTIPSTARDAFLSGQWDPIGELLDGASVVAETAGKLAYMGR